MSYPTPQSNNPPPPKNHPPTRIELPSQDLETLQSILPPIILSPQLITFIDLSHNFISNLTGIEKFPQLQTLHIHHNKIENISEILKIRNKPHLEILSVSFNPLAYRANYRQILIQNFKNLKKVDDLLIDFLIKEEIPMISSYISESMIPFLIFLDKLTKSIEIQLKKIFKSEKNQKSSPTSRASVFEEGYTQQAQKEGLGEGYHEIQNLEKSFEMFDQLYNFLFGTQYELENENEALESCINNFFRVKKVVDTLVERGPIVDASQFEQKSSFFEVFKRIFGLYSKNGDFSLEIFLDKQSNTTYKKQGNRFSESYNGYGSEEESKIKEFCEIFGKIFLGEFKQLEGFNDPNDNFEPYNSDLSLPEHQRLHLKFINSLPDTFPVYGFNSSYCSKILMIFQIKIQQFLISYEDYLDLTQIKGPTTIQASPIKAPNTLNNNIREPQNQPKTAEVKPKREPLQNSDWEYSGTNQQLTSIKDTSRVEDQDKAYHYSRNTPSNPSLIDSLHDDSNDIEFKSGIDLTKKRRSIFNGGSIEGAINYPEQRRGSLTDRQNTPSLSVQNTLNFSLTKGSQTDIDDKSTPKGPSPPPLIPSTSQVSHTSKNISPSTSPTIDDNYHYEENNHLYEQQQQQLQQQQQQQYQNKKNLELQILIQRVQTQAFSKLHQICSQNLKRQTLNNIKKCYFLKRMASFLEREMHSQRYYLSRREEYLYLGFESILSKYFGFLLQQRRRESPNRIAVVQEKKSVLLVRLVKVQTIKNSRRKRNAFFALYNFFLDSSHYYSPPNSRFFDNILEFDQKIEDTTKIKKVNNSSNQSFKLLEKLKKYENLDNYVRQRTSQKKGSSRNRSQSRDRIKKRRDSYSQIKEFNIQSDHNNSGSIIKKTEKKGKQYQISTPKDIYSQYSKKQLKWVADRIEDILETSKNDTTPKRKKRGRRSNSSMKGKRSGSRGRITSQKRVYRQREESQEGPQQQQSLMLEYQEPSNRIIENIQIDPFDYQFIDDPYLEYHNQIVDKVVGGGGRGKEEGARRINQSSVGVDQAVVMRRRRRKQSKSRISSQNKKKKSNSPNKVQIITLGDRKRSKNRIKLKNKNKKKGRSKSKSKRKLISPKNLENQENTPSKNEREKPIFMEELMAPIYSNENKIHKRKRSKSKKMKQRRLNKTPKRKKSISRSFLLNNGDHQCRVKINYLNSEKNRISNRRQNEINSRDRWQD